MSDTKYAYAVARIRAMELSLFSSSTLDQLMALKTYESCLQFLTEKGWGDQDTGMDAEAILTREKEKTWNVVRDLLKKEDAGIINVLSYEKNLFLIIYPSFLECVCSGYQRCTCSACRVRNCYVIPVLCLASDGVPDCYKGHHFADITRSKELSMPVTSKIELHIQLSEEILIRIVF